MTMDKTGVLLLALLPLLSGCAETGGGPPVNALPSTDDEGNADPRSAPREQIIEYEMGTGIAIVQADGRSDGVGMTSLPVSFRVNDLRSNLTVTAHWNATTPAAETLRLSLFWDDGEVWNDGKSPLELRLDAPLPQATLSLHILPANGASNGEKVTFVVVEL